MGLHFLAFWLCGLSFPCILAFWAFISLHFGLVGLHFLAFWPRRLSFPCILALWAFISLHFGLVGFYFPAFWPCGPSFPCILVLWAFISLHFGLVGLHFLEFWPCGLSFPCILALWAFISLHFGLVGFHFLAFWHCGPSFPCILFFWGSASGAPLTSCQKLPLCPRGLELAANPEWSSNPRQGRRRRRIIKASSPSFPCISPGAWSPPLTQNVLLHAPEEHQPLPGETQAAHHQGLVS